MMMNPGIPFTFFQQNVVNILRNITLGNMKIFVAHVFVKLMATCPSDKFNWMLDNLIVSGCLAIANRVHVDWQAISNMTANTSNDTYASTFVRQH